MSARYAVIGITVACLCAGCSPPSFLVTPVLNPSALREQVVRPGEGIMPGKIVIIEVEGMLVNTRGDGLLGRSENPVSLFVQELDKAARDPMVRAVVLRVNSPGGTVSASDAMYEAVRRFRQKTGRPVVASGQEVIASGAYYVACAADRLMVQPTSVAGSIGVIFRTFDVSGTMMLVGMRSEAIKSGPMKDMGSPLKPMTDAERAVMQAMVNEYYERFKQVVAASRKLEGQRLEQASDGRVFTGQQAVAAGLADGTGFLDDAIELARQLGKAPGAEVVIYRRPHGYGGSIYAAAEGHPQTLELRLAPAEALLPTGFYYLWQP